VSNPETGKSESHMSRKHRFVHSIETQPKIDTVSDTMSNSGITTMMWVQLYFS